MENTYLQQLFDEFKKGNQQRIENYKKFCQGCQDNLYNIPTKYPAFISIGESPVAGIGYANSEVTKDCQEKMKNHWEDYAKCLEKIKNNVTQETVKELSEMVNKDRGKKLNLFVNRCVITMHYTELFAIANIDDIELMFDLVKKIGINNIEYEGNLDQKNLEWYNNNKELFLKLKEELKIEDSEKAILSCFGWYLRVKLLKIMSLEKTLENCHNMILTGAPGTGKTYMAKEIARQMGAEIEFAQFHPSYDYTDFVEGLRPKQFKQRVFFEREDGIFKAFCKKAVESFLKNEDKKFVMIIDEINRGEISKIFGELFFSIDPDYRVKREQISGNAVSDTVKSFAIQTQYQNLIPKISDDCFRYGFFVPNNVFIIGTMNDIDRSVESLDFAMRRRFAFVEFIANEHLGMLDNITDEPTKELAKKKMEALNKAIVDPQKGNLSTAYQIGGAYFVNVNKYKNSEDMWEDLWNYHIKGLLFEYYRGQPNVSGIVDMLKKEYENAK